MIGCTEPEPPLPDDHPNARPWPALAAGARLDHGPADTPNYARLRGLCASGDYDVVLTQLRDVIDANLPAQARVAEVSNFAVGYNNVDIAAATAHGILVGNAPGSSSR